MRFRVLVCTAVMALSLAAALPAFAQMPDLPGMGVATKAAASDGSGLPGLGVADSASTGNLGADAASGAGLGQADPNAAADAVPTPAPLGDLLESPAPEVAAASDDLPSTGAPIFAFVLVAIAMLAFGKMALEFRPRRVRA